MLVAVVGSLDAKTSSRLSSRVAHVTNCVKPSESSNTARSASTHAPSTPRQLWSPYRMMTSLDWAQNKAMTSPSSSTNAGTVDEDSDRYILNKAYDGDGARSDRDELQFKRHWLEHVCKTMATHDNGIPMNDGQTTFSCRPAGNKRPWYVRGPVTGRRKIIHCRYRRIGSEPCLRKRQHIELFVSDNVVKAEKTCQVGFDMLRRVYS
jgi:hypothetical protein